VPYSTIIAGPGDANRRHQHRHRPIRACRPTSSVLANVRAVSLFPQRRQTNRNRTVARYIAVSYSREQQVLATFHSVAETRTEVERRRQESVTVKVMGNRCDDYNNNQRFIRASQRSRFCSVGLTTQRQRNGPTGSLQCHVRANS
jgi:hypothetical protein